MTTKELTSRLPDTDDILGYLGLTTQRATTTDTFAATAEVLAGTYPGKPGSRVLALPSLRSAPLDSPELIRVATRRGAQTQPTLLAWTVPVVQVDTADALAVLLSIRGVAPTAACHEHVIEKQLQARYVQIVHAGIPDCGEGLSERRDRK